MRLLLNDELAPITSEIGFLEVECTVAAQAYLEWMRPIQIKRGVSVRQQRVIGTLSEVLRMLLPLTSVEERRILFVPTASRWTAYFDNGYRGTDAMSRMSYLAKQLRCHGLRVVAVPDTIRGESTSARGRYGGTILEVYGPHDTDFLNFIRSLSATNDGGKWVFDQAGTPFPFENLDYYRTRRIKHRFTPEILQAYLNALGLSPFEERFFLPESNPTAYLLEKEGPVAVGLEEFTLDQAREHF